MAVRQIFGPDSGSYKNPSKKGGFPRIPDFYFWRIPDYTKIGFFVLAYKLNNKMLKIR